MGDADDSYDFLDLQGFIDKLDEGYDLVMGNRFKGGIEAGAMPFSHRYIGNPLLSGIGKIFYKTDISDFHCGLRAFRKESIKRLGLCTSGMEFASEMVVKSVLFQLKIAEIPCKLYPDGRDSPPHLRSIPDGWRHLKFLLLYSPQWLFVYPGLAISLIGLIALVTLYFHPIQIGKIQFEIITMFYGAMGLILGMQILQFAIYTDVYGKKMGQFPKGRKLTKNVEQFMQRKGALLGILLIVMGIVGIIVTFYLWSQLKFGPIKENNIIKMALLFGTLLILGCEFLTSFFFINVLQMDVNVSMDGGV